MIRKSLTDSEVLEIVYKSDESFSDSSSDSVSSSDDDTDNITLADVIINDDRGDEEQILHRDFRWETMDNYRGHR
jgi:flavin-binding protein dodecin